MKKSFIFASLLFCTSAVYASTTETTVVIEKSEKEAITITINVSSAGKPVKGALVRITSGTLSIGASSTNELGVATIAIPSYAKQLAIIEVSHSLYKTQKLPEIILENGKAYTFILKGKAETAEEITTESAEKVTKIEEKTAKSEEKTTQYEKEAEQLSAEKEQAVKSAEQLRKEKEEAQRVAEEKQKAAELKQAEVDKQKEANQKELDEAQKIKDANAAKLAEDTKRREEEAKQRAAEAAEREKAMQNGTLVDAKSSEEKAKAEAEAQQKEQQ